MGKRRGPNGRLVELIVLITEKVIEVLDRFKLL
jgi:hypothetical protein